MNIFIWQMTSLESKQFPFRTQSKFYEAQQRPSDISLKRVFPDRNRDRQLQCLYEPSTKKRSTIKYLETISANRALQRRPLQKDQYYSFITLRLDEHSRPFHFGPNNQQSETNKSILSKEQSQSSFFTNAKFSTARSRVASTASILDQKYKSSAAKQMQKFLSQKKLRDKEKKDALRFTFYNSSSEKNHQVMSQFESDKFLEQRQTSFYQNVFKRKIVGDELLKTLNAIDRKRRKGELV